MKHLAIILACILTVLAGMLVNNKGSLIKYEPPFIIEDSTGHRLPADSVTLHYRTGNTTIPGSQFKLVKQGEEMEVSEIIMVACQKTDEEKEQIVKALVESITMEGSLRRLAQMIEAVNRIEPKK